MVPGKAPPAGRHRGWWMVAASPSPGAAPGAAATRPSSRPAATPPPPSVPPAPEPGLDLHPEWWTVVVDRSSDCTKVDFGTVRATATVTWSDGFVAQASATYTSAGHFQLVLPRSWWFDVSVTGPPAVPGGEVISDGLQCTPLGLSGVLQWRG